jgi:hypothetical protein
MAKKAGVPAKGKKPRQDLDDEDQSERFKKAARELGVDESGEAFEKAIGKILPRKASS